MADKPDPLLTQSLVVLLANIPNRLGCVEVRDRDAFILVSKDPRVSAVLREVYKMLASGDSPTEKNIRAILGPS